MKYKYFKYNFEGKYIRIFYASPKGKTLYQSSFNGPLCSGLHVCSLNQGQWVELGGRN